MNKTLSIGLAGFSFVIEEHAYIKLSDYLSALRNSLDANEADEVMHDIEIRIVEILREQMAKREVVNDEDVEKVIAQIGKPEVIEEQEQAYFSEKTEKPRAFSGQKQLFRDPEGKILGGVSGGLGHYFGIDKVWVRLIFIILIFAKGFGLLLYPILWLVIPVANSASDFLKMKGKPANFDNLKNESNKIVQFANESTQRVGQLYQENKHYVADAGNVFATFLRVVFGGIFAFLALIFIIYQLVKYAKRRKASPIVTTNQTLKDLENLKKKKFIENGDYRSFYVELIDISRKFITKQYKIPADVLLTDDLIDVMKLNNTISPENEKIVENIFLRGDLVKFAKTFPDQTMMEKDYEEMKNFVKRSSKDLEAEQLRTGV